MAFPPRSIRSIAALVSISLLLLLLGAGPTWATTLPRQQSEPAQQLHLAHSLTVATTRAGSTTLTETLHQGRLSTAGLPECSVGEITSTAAGSTAGCPRGALLAQGAIAGQFEQLDPAGGIAQGAGAACDPLLSLWNAGSSEGGKKVGLVVFLSFNRAHQCLRGEISTGQIPAFDAQVQATGRGASSQIRLAITMPGSWTFPLGSTGDLRGQVRSASLTWVRGFTRS